jgi:hypothetical protein
LRTRASGLDLLATVTGAADEHLAGLGLLCDRHTQGQHAVVVAGLKLIGVEGVARNS